MINKVTLVGYVGSEPEVRSFEGGSKMARFSVATTERFFSRQTNKSSEHTEWHTIIVWRGLADLADKHLRKGSLVYVEGNIRSREEVDRDSGVKYKVVEIAGYELKLLGRSKASEESATPKPSEPPKVEPPKDDPDNLPF